MSVAVLIPESVWVCNSCGELYPMGPGMTGRVCVNNCKDGFIVGWIVDGTVILDDEILQKEKSEPEG